MHYRESILTRSDCQQEPSTARLGLVRRKRGVHYENAQAIAVTDRSGYDWPFEYSTSDIVLRVVVRGSESEGMR